ncbi:MAG: hypothetical protein ACI936_003754 [Paraglaciecola sp.]|jgi:hypothetical protein
MYSERIAQLLLQATEQILLGRIKSWLVHNHPKVTLQLRVGAGKSTYHRSARGSFVHSITFGKKMIESKVASYKQSARWTTGSEIVNMGYFDGVLTVQNVLAHTITHEFGHFVQSIGGHRREGSVHNDKFYEILDRIHSSGAAHEVLDFLNADAEFESLTFSDSSESGPTYHKDNTKIGDMIVFVDRKGVEIPVKATRINLKTVSAMNGHLKYKIPYELILEVQNNTKESK